MTKRRYSDQERAEALAALAANNGNVAHTARQLNMSRHTLRSWACGTRHPEVIQMSQEKKGPLADTLEAVAFALAGDLADATRRAGAKVTELATALGIVVDKMQILRGQPSSITGQSLPDAERAARLRALVEQFRREAGGTGSPANGAAPALATGPSEPPSANGL